MELLDFLKNSLDIRKIFGKKELNIIEKQLQGVTLTQSEKNRLSRDIRKKLKIIRELAEFKEEFALKKNSQSNQFLNDVKKEILKDELSSKIKRIFLFGSYAEKENTLLSDLDIAVEFNKIDIKEATKFRLRISKIFPKKLDIQVYNFLPKKIQKEINKYGKRIYEKS